MTENKRYLFKVLYNEDEELSRIYIEDTVEPYGDIEGRYHIQNWINNLFEKNEQLKQQNKGLKETIERQNDWEKKAIEKIEQLKQRLKLANDNVGLLQYENDQLNQENERLCNFNLHMVLDDKNKEIEQLKQRINSRLHFYRELYDSTKDSIVKRVVEDLEDILKE